MKPSSRQCPLDELPTRAGEPGLYRCPHCGETLSGEPSTYFFCPGVPQQRVPARRYGSDAAVAA